MKLLFKSRTNATDVSLSTETKLKFAGYYNIATTIVMFIMFIILSNNTNNIMQKAASDVMSKETELQEMKSDYDSLKKNYNYLNGKYKSMSSMVDELTSISTELDEQNKAYYEELKVLRERKELFDKYSYAILNDAGERTDIKYDQIITLKELLKESSIDDEDLILAWIMTESNGNEKAKNTKSTAKGYGQILDGTSKFIYTNLMNNNSADWHSTIALNGDMNIEMMVTYIDYLYDKNNGDLYDIMRDYRGKQDISGYVSKIDSYLENADKSVEDISKYIGTK